MGTIPLRRPSVAPVLVRADTCVTRRGEQRRAVVVFTFGVNYFSESARPVDCAHSVQVGAHAGCLEHHVFQAAVFLDHFQQLFSLLDGAICDGYRMCDMLTMLQYFNAVTGVAWRVSRDPDGLDVVVLDKFFEGWISLLAVSGLCQRLAAIGKKIADGYHFHVRMVLKSESSSKLAGTVSDKPHPHFAIRNGRPDLGLLCFIY